MRKVKVLALLLAALMVVAVFAGCADTDAIVADVDSLEDRVTALEGLLNDQKDAIDDVKDQIGDVSDKLDDDTTADQLAATLEALKQLQEAMNAQNEQIKDLADKVTKVEEDAKESDENADDDAALEAAVKVYTAQLQELKIACELKKDLYILADYEAVVKALSDGIVAVAAAEKADDAKAAFETAKAVYDAKAIVSSKLAAFYAQVANAITADSKALIDEIRAYINLTESTATVVNTAPVYVKYGASAATRTDKAELMVDNINGAKTNGVLDKVNVVAELQKAVAAYDYITGANNNKTFANKVKDAVDAIAAIQTVTYGKTSLTNAQTKLNAVKEDVLGNASATALNTNVYANYVADSVLAQVTNAAELTAAQNRVVELAVAAAMYDTYGAQSESGIASIFAGYNALTDKTLYTNKAVYDAVDTVLNKWIADYKLEAVNVQNIVNDKNGDKDGVADDADYYYTYTLNKLTTELSVKAYTDFAAIANRIEALNKLTTVVAANVTEYGDIAKAIETWVVLQKASTAENATRLEKESIKITAANVEKILEAYEIDATALTFDSDNKLTNLFDLCAFVNTDVEAFFQNQYATINAEKTAINDNIAELKANLTAGTKYTSIKRYLELEGLYADDDNDGIYTKVTVTADDKALKENGLKKDSLTIAAFLKKYEAHDLSSLLKLADFEAAKAGAIERINGFKAGAANIATLVDAIDYVELKKGANEYTFSVPAEGDAIYYYVNLSDADAIAAAEKAYTAWITSGANSDLKEYVPYVDPTTKKVVADKYVFESLIDAEVLAALKQMNERVTLLKTMAAKLVAHYELVAQVWDAVAPTVALVSDRNTQDVNVLTLYKATLDAGYNVTVDGVKVPGAIPVATSSASANSFTVAGQPYYLAAKGNATSVENADAASATIKELIFAGNNAYEAFMTMNRNITVKANKSGLDKQDYVKDSAVEAAVKGIAAAELVMIKDAALDAVAQATNLTAEQKSQYTEWLRGATALGGYTGSTVWVYAQQIYAQSTLKLDKDNTVMAEYIKRGNEVISGKNAATVFQAPSYSNID